MSMSALVGLSFGVFPCLLFGFIMLLSLLICEYIEEYVAKHLCAWKNSRRRRGLRSFYRDFRERRNAENQASSSPSKHHRHQSSSSSSTARSRGGGDSSGAPELLRLMPSEPPSSSSFPPTAPPLVPLPSSSSTSFCYQRGSSSQHQQLAIYPILSGSLSQPANLSNNDPPPSYEECVLPQLRLFQNYSTVNTNENYSKNQQTAKSSTPSKSDKEAD